MADEESTDTEAEEEEVEEETEQYDEDMLEAMVGRLDRDTTTGELALVTAVDPDDSTVYYVTRANPRGDWMDAARFDDKYDQQVVAPGEAWRQLKRPNTNFMFEGQVVRVDDVDLLADGVTTKSVDVPMARDSDAFCRLRRAETIPLGQFLSDFERVAHDAEDGTWPDYEPSETARKEFAEERAKLKKKVEAVGAPEDKADMDLFVASGLLDEEDRDKKGSGASPPPGAGFLTGLLDALLSDLNEAARKVGRAPERDRKKEMLESLGVPSPAPEGETQEPASFAEENDMDEQQQYGAKKMTANDFKEVKLVRQGHQVILPETMSTKVAIEWLTRIDKEDERVVAVNHELPVFPIEGAYALYRALKEKYGFISLTHTPSFFGPQPPQMVGLDVSIDEHVQVPWGRIVIPGVSGHLETSATAKPDGSLHFVLSGEVKRRDEEEVNKLVTLVREFATSRSIYKGKAVRVRFPTNPKEWDFTYLPDFIDTRKTRPSDLVLPAETGELVQNTLFSPIEKTALCRATGVPLKRGILFEGPYGTGKTLTAYVTAKKCEENGWTFMYVDKTADLKQAIRLAQNYQPCVIFAEDIDRALQGNERTDKMNDILNTIDGVDGKNSEVIVVLTTNHVEEINRAMLRPGRLDAVIPVRAPDAPAAIKLVRTYGRDLLVASDEEMVPVGEELAGLIPAVIREVVERAKLAAITRLPADSTRLTLRPSDLLQARASIKAQLELMAVPPADKREPIERAADTLAAALYATAPGGATEVPVNGHGATDAPDWKKVAGENPIPQAG